MMKKDRQVEKFAEKIARFCTHKGLKAILRSLISKNLSQERKNGNIKALRFHTLKELSAPKQPTVLKQKGPRLTQKISVDLLFRAKPLSKDYKCLYEAAFDAHKCCRNQDLHLYPYEQIYHSKRLYLKDIKGWRFPKTMIAKKQLNYTIDQIQSFKNGRENIHRVKIILLAAEGQKEEEKSITEHIELEKQLREKRDYINQKSLFS